MRIGDLVRHADGYIGIIVDQRKSVVSFLQIYLLSGDVGFWTEGDRLEVIA